MADDVDLDQPRTQVAVRTLLAAGFTIQGSHRQPRHIEIRCQRTDVLGATIPYLVALAQTDELTNDEVEDIQRSAEAQSRTLAIVAQSPGDHWIAWDDFTEALGGAVPSWQALGPTYISDLLIASKNELPAGTAGEAWLVFEDLVAYGLEFVFGRRVRRLGGRRRGRTVSDMQAQLPEEIVLVVDAKAAREGFDVTWPSLRALVEYVERQRTRQHGHLEVFGALVVSSGFAQKDERLAELSRQFFGEARVPVSFLDVELLSRIVTVLRERPDMRNAIRWTSILTGGRIRLKAFEDEFSAAQAERIARGE